MKIRHLALAVCSLLIFSSPAARAQVFLTENFTNAGLLTNNGWTGFSGTTNFISAGSPVLFYAGLPSSGVGNSAGLTNTGQDAYKLLSSNNTTGDIYTSFLVNLSSAGTGDYFYSLYSTNASGGGYFGRVFAQASGSGFNFGISRNTSTSSQVSYETNVRSFSTTYMVVTKMARVDGLSNDVVSLWVNPVLGASETTPLLTNNIGADNTVGISAVALRQGSTTPGARLGNILVGSSWFLVTPATATGAPTITSFTPDNGVAGTTVTITGTDFTGATAVKFNGVEATFTVNSATQITATAPSASSGIITVTTAAGTGPSTTSFSYPTATLILPSSINEGTNATGRVTLNVTPDSDVDVTLTSSSINDLNVESPVTVFGGTSFSDFAITAPADGVVDSNVVVTVTPSASGFVSAPASITVINTNLASVSLPAGGYTQDFSTFSNAPTLPLGWSLAASVQTYTEWGTNNASGAKYSSPTVNVFGYKHTGSTGIVNQVLNLKNTTGSTITDLTVSYYGRAYINTGDARYPFYTVTVAGSTVTALAYSTADGDNVNRSASLSGLNIANNEEFQVVWSSDGSSAGSPGSSSRTQIGVSAVSVAIGAASFPPTVGSLAVPVVTIYQTTAQASADVSSDGGAAITSRGFVYAQTSVNADPTIGGTGVSNVVDASSATGPMSASLTGLSSSTQYSIKAYAANVEGTTYTSVQSFTTLAPNPSFSGVYTQSFNGFTNMAAMPAGWRCFSSSNLNNYAGDWNSQSATTGGFYGRTNIPGILGYLHTSGSGILSNGLTLINNTGATLTNLFVSYMGEVNLTNNGRSPIYAVSVDGQTVEALAYSTEGGTNAFQSAQITGLSITNGGEVIISWASDRGASAGNGSSKMIGMTSVRVATSPIPEAPVITSPSSAQGTNGVAFSYQITANNNPTSFGASNLPAGLSVNTNSGLISGTPTVTTSVTVALSASNEGGTGTSTLSLNIVAASDSTFTSWAEGAPLNSANLELYAIGGATSPTATDGVPSQTALTSSNLSIIAIVRTNDPNLTVFGQATANLKNVPWTTNGVTKTNAPDQLSVPSGTARQIFSIERGTNTSLFLRIDSILQP